MTKAERIFMATRHECMAHILDWGYKLDQNGKAIGFNSVFYNDDEFICTRTLNDLEKILASRRKMADRHFKYGSYDAARYELETQILNTVESTIRNNRASLEKFEREMKAIRESLHA